MELQKVDKNQMVRKQSYNPQTFSNMTKQSVLANKFDFKKDMFNRVNKYNHFNYDSNSSMSTTELTRTRSYSYQASQKPNLEMACFKSCIKYNFLEITKIFYNLKMNNKIDTPKNMTFIDEIMNNYPKEKLDSFREKKRFYKEEK